MQTIRFNTRRRYTAQGQRITATLHDDGVVTFNDHDRRITGEFELGQHCSFNDIEVMHWYDASQFKQSRRADEDGRHGGCNANWEEPSC